MDMEAFKQMTNICKQTPNMTLPNHAWLKFINYQASKEVLEEIFLKKVAVA